MKKVRFLKTQSNLYYLMPLLGFSEKGSSVEER